MWHRILPTLLPFLYQWGYFAFFLLTFLESSAFLGFLVPGESTMVIAGLLASRNILELGDVIWVASLGAILGDTVGYALGRWFGESFFLKRGRFFFFEKASLEDAKRFFDKHGGKVVFFGRFIAWLRAFAPVVAGISRMPYFRFLFFNVLGGILWAAAFSLLGYFVGNSWSGFSDTWGKSALLAARKGKEKVEMADFDEAVDRIVGGLEKKTRVMNPKEKETVAYHEAGHALVAEFRPHADRVSKISIIPRGVSALGYTQQLPTEDRYLLKRSELLDRLDVLLGGRVAEEIVFGDISTGAQNDLQRATDMARHMITQYGMSDDLGLTTFEEPRPSPYLNIPSAPGQRAYSERTAQSIDDEIKKLLDDAHVRVRKTLTAQRATLESLAKLLLEKEVVDRTTLDNLLKTHREPHPRPSRAG